MYALTTGKIGYFYSDFFLESLPPEVIIPSLVTIFYEFYISRMGQTTEASTTLVFRIGS